MVMVILYSRMLHPGAHQRQMRERWAGGGRGSTCGRPAPRPKMGAQGSRLMDSSFFRPPCWRGKKTVLQVPSRSLADLNRLETSSARSRPGSPLSRMFPRTSAPRAREWRILSCLASILGWQPSRGAPSAVVRRIGSKTSSQTPAPDARSLSRNPSARRPFRVISATSFATIPSVPCPGLIGPGAAKRDCAPEPQPAPGGTAAGVTARRRHRGPWACPGSSRVGPWARPVVRC